ncbi:unnamed protein product, partial [Iphiclides podalirius]
MEGRFIASRSFVTLFGFIYLFTCVSSENATIRSRPSIRRLLVVGDILTPTEMVPIAIKLLHKFKRTKRIVILKEADILGLDALQALVLKEKGKSNGIRISKFDLLSKAMEDKIKFPNPKRRGIPLAEKLRKKRRLVIKNRRRNFTGANSSDPRERLQFRRELTRLPEIHENAGRIKSLTDYFNSILQVENL